MLNEFCKTCEYYFEDVKHNTVNPFYADLCYVDYPLRFTDKDIRLIHLKGKSIFQDLIHYHPVSFPPKNCKYRLELDILNG